jgi:hypothetical protein
VLTAQRKSELKEELTTFGYAGEGFGGASKEETAKLHEGKTQEELLYLFALSHEMIGKTPKHPF